jgi:hypothetical protein
VVAGRRFPSEGLDNEEIVEMIERQTLLGRGRDARDVGNAAIFAASIGRAA